MSTQNTITFGKSLKAGAIAGVIGAGLNNLWSIIAQQLGSVAPHMFAFAVTMSSIFPVIIGAILFFLLVKYTSKGLIIFLVISGVFTLVSCFGPFQPVLPDGTVAPEGFPLLAVPMHIISGVLAMWGIPKFSK